MVEKWSRNGRVTGEVGCRFESCRGQKVLTLEIKKEEIDNKMKILHKTMQISLIFRNRPFDTQIISTKKFKLFLFFIEYSNFKLHLNKIVILL